MTDSVETIEDQRIYRIVRSDSTQSEALRSARFDENSITGDPLSIYAFNQSKRRWTRTLHTDRLPKREEGPCPLDIQILTWNVDFAEEHKDERMQCVLEHIQKVVFDCKDAQTPPACCLLLQEVEIESLPIILGHEWIRKHFFVTPISNFNWPQRAHYGNVTMISRSIPVRTASSLLFKNSHMARNALMVDLQFESEDNTESAENADKDTEAPEGQAKQRSPKIFRVANVHLESLQQGAHARPEQLKLVARAVREPKEVYGGIICGDMNAILESDRNTPSEVGLIDAYSNDEPSADEKEEGHTWGYQPRLPYPPARIDKILYVPASGRYTVERPMRIGVGLQTARGQWASDHYGLVTRLKIEGKVVK